MSRDGIDTRKFFGRTAGYYYRENYDAPSNRHEYTLALRREVCLNLLTPERVTGPILDLGCGPGAMTIPLLERGHVVVATDFSLDMVQEAVRRMSEHATAPRAVVADATKLPFENGSFAAVVTTGVLEYVSDLATALSEVHRVLAPDGVFIATMSLPRRFERRAVRLFSTLRGRSAGATQYIYDRGSFDEVVVRGGFEIEARRCSSFTPFPLDVIWPRSIVWLERALGEQLNGIVLACDQAKTYVVLARRVANAHSSYYR